MEKRQQNLFDAAPPPWEIDDADDLLVAEVVFAEAPYGPFDYRVPDEFRDRLQLGCRVHVPLGRGNRQVEGGNTS